MSIQVKASGCSDIGLIRQNNEDVWSSIPEYHFYLLADGMGGHQAGEVASAKAVDTLKAIVQKRLTKKKNLSVKDMREFLYEAIQIVNEQVFELGTSSVDLQGMGTTLCCLYIQDDGIVYANVGDSRIYRIRKRKLKQLSKDDSLLQEMLDLGQIEGEEVGLPNYKNILTKAIGTEPYIEPTVHVTDFHEGDLFLLCSDGLTDLLSQEEIEGLLNQATCVEKCADRLVSAAIEAGGHDNVTVVVVQVHKNHETEDLSRS